MTKRERKDSNLSALDSIHTGEVASMDTVILQNISESRQDKQDLEH